MGVKRIATSVLLGMAALVMVPSAAQAADHGDGRTGCSNGEICFQMSWNNFTTSQWQRHFWYSDSNHTNDTWGNVPDDWNTFYFNDMAKGIWNRDTQCSVMLYQSTGYRNAYAAYHRGNRMEMADLNKSHKRCY